MFRLDEEAKLTAKMQLLEQQNSQEQQSSELLPAVTENPSAATESEFPAAVTTENESVSVGASSCEPPSPLHSIQVSGETEPSWSKFVPESLKSIYNEARLKQAAQAATPGPASIAMPLGTMPLRDLVRSLHIKTGATIKTA